TRQVTFTYEAVDDSGTANDTSEPATVTITITGTNDKPTAADNTVTLNEDGSHTFAASEFGFSDAEDSSLSSVRITQLPAAGTLTLNGSAVTANQIISSADIPNLVFSPEANANGSNYASLQFKVIDSGGLESAAQTMTLDVTAISDAPTATDMSLVTAESEAYVFMTDDFGFSDVDGDSLHSVTIKSLPVNGSLTYDGAAVFVNQVIAATDVSKLQFTAPSVTTDTSTSFAFTVSDGTNSSVQQTLNISTVGTSRWSDNLVTNPSAVSGTTGWTVTNTGGDGWTIRGDSHDGDGTTWGTSHGDTSKAQNIDLVANGYTAEYLDSAPEISVSEWYKQYYGDGDTYRLIVELRDINGDAIATFDTSTLNATTSWQEASHTFQNYGAGVRSIFIEHTGNDGEGWENQWGTLIDDTSIRIANEVNLSGSGSDDVILGTDGKDDIQAGAGNDIIIGGDGDDLLTGGTGADVFRFKSGDEGTTAAPAFDVIEDFNRAEGDVLDLSDMLVGESAATIDAFLDLSTVVDNGVTSTQIAVKDSANGQTVQTIKLDGVDLSSLGSEADILNNLLNNGNLDIDQ
ncbi:MAG: hypothetical protein B0D91_07865, partial [Oceanospirillales bacterium LUC14_002_19_P2]